MKMKKMIVEKVDGKYYVDGERIVDTIPNKTNWTAEDHQNYKVNIDKIVQLLSELKTELKPTRQGTKHG